MYYKNPISRFLFRKNFVSKVKLRLGILNRKINKNEFPDIADLFKAAGVTPKVAVDGGAYIGFVTHQMLTNFPESHVYSFEPNPVVFETLKKAYQGNPKVTPINAGIGSSTGEMLFQINKRAVTSSFLPANEYHKMNIASSNIKIEKVKITTIDDALQPYGVEHIDVLKLDIEGFEIEGFKGIKDIDKRVSVIFAEVNLIPTYEGQPLMDDVIIYMRNHNFNLVNFYGIIENQYHQATVTNLLFISNDFKEKLKAKVGDKYFGY
jgi:FkbM family methyltransferase